MEKVLAAKSPSELKQLQSNFRPFPGGGGEREDDEEDISTVFQPIVEDADTGRLDIEDGIIEKDVIPSLEDDTTPLTRIVVRYLPGEETSAKRPRGHHDDGDDNFHKRSVRRTKLRSQNNSNGSNYNGHSQTELDKLLEQSSPFTLANTMTRLDIYNMCVNRKTSPDFIMEPTEAFQKGHPDLDNEADMWGVQRLYNDILEAAQIHMFAGDTQAILRLRKAILASVRDWSWSHLQDFCNSNGLPFNGDIDQVRRRIRRFMRAEIEAVRHHDDKNLRSGESADSEEDHATGKADNPESWPVSELQNFCRQNDIPEVGIKTSLIIRTKRYLKEQARRKRIPRGPQRDRTDTNGYEVYTFRAILGQSTVTALKSALLIQGNFPPEAILTLYFKTDYGYPLRDEEPLSKYAPSDWEALRLEVTGSSKSGPGSMRRNPIGADVVHFSDPIPLPGSDITYAIEIPDFPIITIGDEPTPADLLGAAKADPAVQREAAVKITGANPTFAELLTSVGDRALILERVVTAGGKFWDRNNPRPATSGLSILEELDYLEDEENRKKNLKALMEAPEPVPRKPEERYPLIGRATWWVCSMLRIGNIIHPRRRKNEGLGCLRLSGQCAERGLCLRNFTWVMLNLDGAARSKLPRLSHFPSLVRNYVFKY